MSQDYDASLYPGKLIWGHVYGSSDKYSQEIADVQLNVRTWYDSGAPFFTKQAIQDLQNQLQSSLQTGEKIVIKGLDGKIIEVENETGKVFPIGASDFERVLQVH